MLNQLICVAHLIVAGCTAAVHAAVAAFACWDVTGGCDPAALGSHSCCSRHWIDQTMSYMRWNRGVRRPGHAGARRTHPPVGTGHRKLGCAVDEVRWGCQGCLCGVTPLAGVGCKHADRYQRLGQGDASYKKTNRSRHAFWASKKPRTRSLIPQT